MLLTAPDVDAVEKDDLDLDAGRHLDDWLVLFGALDEVSADRIGSFARALAETALPAPAFPVRALLFDKTPGTNWKVPWHQDLAIAVAERREVEDFGPWSVKDGVPHVHAPVWLFTARLP